MYRAPPRQVSSNQDATPACFAYPDLVLGPEDEEEDEGYAIVASVPTNASGEADPRQLLPFLATDEEFETLIRHCDRRDTAVEECEAELDDELRTDIDLDEEWAAVDRMVRQLEWRTTELMLSDAIASGGEMSLTVPVWLLS